MSSRGGGEPSGSLGKRIEESFGSFKAFKDQFSGAAVGLFGVCWTWLCVESDGDLIITTTQNQDNPIVNGLVPILGLDVWEHAYYLKYENRRPDYVAAWWNVVDWSYVSGNLVGVNIQQGADNVADWAKSTWSNLFD
jgi:Fe-Mn family superoxide dismutase